MGWNGKTNGQLLALLTATGFDILITLDKSLYQQQNLTNYLVTVILLRVKTNKYEDIQPILPKLFECFKERPEEKLLILTSD